MHSENFLILILFLLQLKTPPEQEKSILIMKISGSVLGDALIGWYGNEVHSPALIDWADCVIVIGGSIALRLCCKINTLFIQHI